MVNQVSNNKARLIIFFILIIFILIGILLYINLGYKPLCIYILFFCLFCILFSLFKVFTEIRYEELQQS